MTVQIIQKMQHTQTQSLAGFDSNCVYKTKKIVILHFHPEQIHKATFYLIKL